MIENCVIRDLSRIDRTYTPAVLMQGVGIKVQYCRFDKIPSSAIRIEGNDMLIQLSEFSNCNTESDDQGTIESFNNPLFRGNTIRWNYFHDIGEDPTYMAAGVRLDDAICGYNVTENIFVNASRSVFGGVQIHGGKDNIIEGNVFADCNAMISQSAWEEKRWLASMKTHPVLSENDYWKSPVWQKRYPDLQDVLINYDKNYSIDSIAVNAHALYLRASKQIEILNDLKAFDDVVKRSLSGIRENYIQPWHDIPVDEIGPYTPDAVFKDTVQIGVPSGQLDKSPGPGQVSASLFVSQRALPEKADGSMHHPCISIEDALKTAVSIIKTQDLPEGIVEIVVIDRKHVLSKPVLLTKDLSGTKANPIIIRSRRESVLSGGVNMFAWKQDHGAIAGFLPLHARRKVIIADLQENGVDAADLVLPDDSDPRIHPFPELYYDGKLQNVATYPKGDGISSSIGDFKHSDLPAWTAERDVWVKGYSGKLKSGVFGKVENNEASIISLKENYRKLDIDFGKWYVMNSITAIDQTGDYKIGIRGLFENKDNKWGYPEGKGAVWFFAPPAFNPDLAILSVSPHAFIMKGAVHVSIENFKFEYFRGADIKTQ